MKQPNEPAPAPAPIGPTLVLTAILSATLGALGMWLYSRTQTPPPRVTNTNPPGHEGHSHEPAPELTAGMAPAQAARTRGNFFYDHTEWRRAIAEYESAIRLGSDDADIRTDLANAYHFTGQFGAAIANYETAQRLNPNHEASLFNLGVLYANAMGDTVNARATWERFLARFPNSPKAAAARDSLAGMQALPPGHPPVGGQGTAAPAGGSDADIDRLMQHVQPPPKR